MSGGAFDYRQDHIQQIADSIEQEISKSGRQKTKEELKEEYWRNADDWYTRYPEDLCHHKYPDEVIAEFKKGLAVLREAYIYTKRIDWLLSGDDGNESFLSRLSEELNKLKNSI
jgi:hypothetical protein